ncbi:conserved Plasmodium protein, unknown function [Plasmodium ovale curtisi]|uniref:Ubiquitin-like domain-containing protein n=2 Tax=Plasmodium ovale TaxID=36330 RepID=A0A1A8VI81_PLAOA|nr:conserved Plasmodium protein, unknown function [Plasmodium ovale curtisi]SBS80367.1 conserved Plasmodium protein, unknown function [Plasmodium ovale curtisi]
MDDFSKGMITSLLVEENRKKEKKNEMEKQIKINFCLPDGKTVTVKENVSIEVGYLKLELSKKLQKPYDKIHLTYNKNIMLDPLSVIDIIKTNLDTINICVNYC